MGTWSNLREIVFDLLSPAGVDVYYQMWKPLQDQDIPPDTYITYQEMLAQNGQMADDAAQERERYLLVDIWSTEPREDVAQAVRDALEGAFFYLRDERDVPETDTGTYHRTSTWITYEEA